MVELNGYTARKIAEMLSCGVNFDDFIIDKITLNSKELEINNSCFFAIKGKKFDGHSYVEEAVKNGAKLVVAQNKIKTRVPVIYVENTVKALGKLASIHKGKTKIIGVTGSVGKTTVKNMIFTLLKEKYKIIATEENYNNEIGVPLTLLRIKDEDFCVVEMGMRNLGEIDYLASITMPETAVITNAYTSHLERLKTKENIFFAKKEILNYNPKYAILPNEERFKMLDLQGVTTFFIDDKENFFIDSFVYTKDGIAFSIKTNNRVINNIKLKSFSKHNLYNSLVACKVAEIYGLSDDEIVSGFNSYQGCKMREEIIKIKNGLTIISDCYNSSFESIKSAVEALKEYCKINNKKMKVLLGDVLEAGDISEKMHYQIGQTCKKQGVCELFAYGKYAESIIAGFGGGRVFKCKEEIAEIITKNTNKNDVLLVKASRSLYFEEIIDEMKDRNG